MRPCPRDRSGGAKVSQARSGGQTDFRSLIHTKKRQTGLYLTERARRTHGAWHDLSRGLNQGVDGRSSSIREGMGTHSDKQNLLRRLDEGGEGRPAKHHRIVHTKTEETLESTLDSSTSSWVRQLEPLTTREVVRMNYSRQFPSKFVELIFAIASRQLWGGSQMMRGRLP